MFPAECQLDGYKNNGRRVGRGGSAAFVLGARSILDAGRDNLGCDGLVLRCNGLSTDCSRLGSRIPTLQEIHSCLSGVQLRIVDLVALLRPNGGGT